MNTIKNNHTYMVQIIHFFSFLKKKKKKIYTFFVEEVQIIHGINLHFLNHRSLKYVIVYFIYIYIYDLEFNWF